MSEIATLFVKISAKAEEFEKSFGEVRGKLDQLSDRFDKAGKSMTKNITAPAIAAGTAMFAFANRTANAGDEIQKMALRTGFSTEALSEFKHAAELSGSSIETVETGVKRMQKVLTDAERGLSTSTQALDELGLSHQKLAGMNPEEQFTAFANAIASIENPSKRAALAQEVFGRAGTQLLPMFAQGADGIAEMRQEAHELGKVFSQEAADASAKFNDDLLRLKSGMGGVFQELGMKLIPIMVDQFFPVLQQKIIPAVATLVDKVISLITWFTELDPKWQKVIGIAIAFAIALGPLLIIIGKIISVVGIITSMLPILGAAFAALAGPIGIAIVAIGAAVAAGIWLWQNWDMVRVKITEIWQAIVRAVVGQINNMIEAIEGGFNWAIRAVNSFIDKINSVISGLNRVPGVDIPLVPKIGEISLGRLSMPVSAEMDGYANVNTINQTINVQTTSATPSEVAKAVKLSSQELALDF